MATAPKKTADRRLRGASTDASNARDPAAPVSSLDALQDKLDQLNSMVQAMPYNAHKAAEHGFTGPGQANSATPAGEQVEPPMPTTTASTLSEAGPSAKTGAAAAQPSHGPDGNLERVRVESGGQRLTTNQGVPVADNQNSLKYGLRGPALLEDFVLREKLTHFDHERIPERVVHARGSGAHGVFECLDPITALTRAAPFQQAGKRTPVFARFSTVAGERGSKDTARDVRGFAVKFYTDEGIWDLVGNNMPVFFIQDAMKFPDLVHAVKPEPHNAMPQAASAHDTFWDFVSLMPESTHTLMWLMSDRAIPRSFATMEGFGVHSFKLVNAAGESVFVKFHWKPRFGTVSLVWDEAVKISGADPDFHRRDLWQRIEAGIYPQWDLGIQVIPEDKADSLSFDILDSTKLVPEELFPVQIIGRMTLNRNPDNFFAETEQVAFCTAHVVPGIDFSDDPLLAGRVHSYVDTQISRLGGANFHEIPINAPLSPVHNNQRDGMHRQAVHRGQVAYEPNSLAGGCPFQAGSAQGFETVASRLQNTVELHKVRAKPEKFADHYTQATLFYDSQTPVEQQHIAAAYIFELGKVTVPAIRERMVASLRNVSSQLAQQVADGLGMEKLPAPMPRALNQPVKPEVMRSESLSLTFRQAPSVEGRSISLLVANGVEAGTTQQLHAALMALGAMPRYIGLRVGVVHGSDGVDLMADASMEGEPGFLFDAVVLPRGQEAIAALAHSMHTVDYLKSLYRHGKTIVASSEDHPLLEQAGISPRLPNGDPDPGIVWLKGEVEGAMESIAAAVTRRQHPEREQAFAPGA